MTGQWVLVWFCLLAGTAYADIQLNFPSTKLGTGPYNVVGNISADAITLFDGVEQPGRRPANVIFESGSPMMVSLRWNYDQELEYLINDEGVVVTLRDLRVYLTCPSGNPQLTYARGVNNQYTYLVGVPLPTNLPTSMPVFATLVCGLPECSLNTTSLDFGTTQLGTPVQRTFTITNTGGDGLVGVVTEDCPEYEVINGSYSLAQNQSHTVTITYNPSSFGTHTCILDAGSNCEDIAITGSAVLMTEPFNHTGSLAPGWTTQSNATVLTTPWAPILESGTDYAVQTSQVAFSTPRTEWLISPIYNLTGYQDIELGYTHAYTHAGSTATVKYSTNGGLSWQNLANYNSTISGNIVTDIASWADNQANVRFAFVFTGTFNIGGSSWRIDDFYLDGTRIAPLASSPSPSQPPTAWASLTVSVGCTWTQPLGVSGTDLEVRIDANGDGDYLDAGAENWQPIADLPNASSLTFSTSVTYLQADTDLAFEFRARSGQGLWGYSGTSNTEGIEDDWVVSIDVDTTPPTFANPIPTGQPTPAWLPTLQPQVGVTVLDADSGVDASTLAWRIDLDQNGFYSGPAEDWQPITGYADGSQIDVIQTAMLPADGEYRVEFRAQDLAGNGPAHSLGEEGITDDIVVRVDTTPPTPSTLFVSGSGLNSVTLMFSPTSEDHFARYEVRCSQDTLVDETDLLWTDAQDPNLAQIGTYQTTVTDLSSGTAWYFRLWAVDLAGNRSPASNLVRKVTEGSQVSPVTDLQAVLQGNDILLTWSVPTTDIFGQSPVAIDEYQVHSSLDARFTPNASTLVGTTTSISYLVMNPGGDVRAFYRVVVVGAGPGNPFPVPMIRVPAGTFMMGQEGVSEPVHQVTLTHDFWLGETEITNQQFIYASQWAVDNAFATVISNQLHAYGFVLLEMNSPDCEITFSDGQFGLRMAPGAGQWGFDNTDYDPAQHPVKMMSWYGSVCYCDWLSIMNGLEPYYQGLWNQIPAVRNPYESQAYRLPTEAEWEYSAQYNDGRLYPWGNVEPTLDVANYSGDGSPLWIGWTTPVGFYQNGKSALEIHDLGGNVAELCNDWESPYIGTDVVDPIGASTGSVRVKRGGTWDGTSYGMQCSNRYNYGPYDSPYRSLGFRICRTIQ